jgi:hypothetical protein
MAGIRAVALAFRFRLMAPMWRAERREPPTCADRLGFRAFRGGRGPPEYGPDMAAAVDFSPILIVSLCFEMG